MQVDAAEGERIIQTFWVQAWKWTNVIGRDEAEIRGVSSGKAQEAGELPPTGPLTGLACPG